MDKLFHGRNPFGSSRKTAGSEKPRPAYYDDRNDRHTRSHISQISAAPRKRSDPADPARDLVETMVENSSQEHLAPQQRKRPIDIESQISTMEVQSSNDASPGDDTVSNGGSLPRRKKSKIGIVLTNEVIVSYETREGDMELKEPDMPWERMQRHWPLR